MHTRASLRQSPRGDDSARKTRRGVVATGGQSSSRGEEISAKRPTASERADGDIIRLKIHPSRGKISDGQWRSPAPESVGRTREEHAVIHIGRARVGGTRPAELEHSEARFLNSPVAEQRGDIQPSHHLIEVRAVGSRELRGRVHRDRALHPTEVKRAPIDQRSDRHIGRVGGNVPRDRQDACLRAFRRGGIVSADNRLRVVNPHGGHIGATITIEGQAG